MKKRYSVFINDKYYYDFIALYNSWKYYENIIPLKIYVANNELCDEYRKIIESKFEVVDVSMDGYTLAQFKGKYLFKWIGLLNYMEDCEILLDADTIFLSNMDHLFDHLEEGKLIGAREDVDVAHFSYCPKEEWDDEHIRIQSKFREYIGDKADNYTKTLITPTYNAGLMGFNKIKHKFLLEKSIELLMSGFDSKFNPTFHLEQFMINVLLHLYSVDIFVLDQKEWMNTWWFHKKPKKVIKVDDGKLVLYNENGNRINFYHFTGDLGMPNHVNGELNACRTHQLYKSLDYEPKFDRTDVEKLWYVKHENPVLLLYEFFFNKGL
jgi:hypothetical protein